MKTEGLSEEREGRKNDSKTPGGDGRRRESRLSSIHNTRCNCTGPAPWPRAGYCKEADRRTMEETRGGEEERATEGQGDGWVEQPSAWSLHESDRTMEERYV